jgi:hypothetical protein
MPLSLNSVIHYTNHIDKLKGILSDKFRLFFCLETVTGQQVAFPMVSFCDIPFSQIKAHTESYGSYGIGLSREWANNNNLNPVLYVNHNSHLEQTLKRYQEKLMEESKTSGKVDLEMSQLNIQILAFVKSFKGIIDRGTGPIEIIFYNEKEWRYIPHRSEIQKIQSSFHLWGPNYMNHKDRANDSLKDLRLYFAIGDIEYIIVKCESEIHNIIDHLKLVFASEPIDKLELLITKIKVMAKIESEY